MTLFVERFGRERLTSLLLSPEPTFAETFGAVTGSAPAAFEREVAAWLSGDARAEPAPAPERSKSR